MAYVHSHLQSLVVWSSLECVGHLVMDGKIINGRRSVVQVCVCMCVYVCV